MNIFHLRNDLMKLEQAIVKHSVDRTSAVERDIGKTVFYFTCVLCNNMVCVLCLLCLEYSLSQLREYEDRITADIQNHLMKSNSNTKGVILWLKHGASSINPEPIHMKEIISYLISNCTFTSTGFDICEIYNLDMKSKYEKVLRALYVMRQGDSVVVPLLENQKLDVEALLAIKNKYSLPDVTSKELED